MNIEKKRMMGLNRKESFEAGSERIFFEKFLKKGLTITIKVSIIENVTWNTKINGGAL